MSEKDDTFMRITNQMVYNKLEDIEKVQLKTLEQATRTNGRVTALENTSVGRWITLHPVKFAFFLMLFFGLVISDFRHPVIEFIAKFI